MIPQKSASSNTVVTEQLKTMVADLEALGDTDFIGYSGPLFDSTPDIFKAAIEEKAARRKKLTIWVETNGGLVESTERTAFTVEAFQWRSFGVD